MICGSAVRALHQVIINHDSGRGPQQSSATIILREWADDSCEVLDANACLQILPGNASGLAIYLCEGEGVAMLDWGPSAAIPWAYTGKEVDPANAD
jgi:hypothetical protein